MILKMEATTDGNVEPRRLKEGDTIKLGAQQPDSLILAKQTLVGKVIGDEVLHRKTIKSVITKGWGDPVGLKCEEFLRHRNYRKNPES